MGVLFLTPNWNAVSERWIARQIEVLADAIIAIGACEPAEPRWRGRIPALDLAAAPLRLWRRVAHRAGLPLSHGPQPAHRALAAAVARDDVSVVLVHYIDFALRFEKVWERVTKPVFVHPHGYDTEWDYRRKDSLDQPFFKSDYPARVRRLADHVRFLANSELVRRRLLAIGVPRERIVLQYFPIPAPARPPFRPPRTRALEFLFLGRLVDCKGPDVVLRAFERACDRGLDARLILAGDGHLRTTCELLKRRSRWSGRMYLPGAVDGPAADRLRAAADVFTLHNCPGPLTRQEESFGVAVVEALAAGLPVVTGRSGGVCETVVHGETGLLVEPNDIEGHADALLTLARDPDLRHRMGLAGWRHVRAQFCYARRAAELRAVLGLPPTPTDIPEPEFAYDPATTPE